MCRALSTYRLLVIMVVGFSASCACADSAARITGQSVTPSEGPQVRGQSGDSGAERSAGGSPSTTTSDAGLTPLLFDFCSRAGEPPFQQLMVMLSIANGYDASRRDDCRTQGLMPPLAPAQQERWLAYLVNYSMALAGCPLTRGPAPGGIFVFGPANTRAIGLDRPLLGVDDVERLIQSYLNEFASALRLSGTERAAVEAHLWSVAQPEIDSNVSAILSQCLPDAGR